MSARAPAADSHPPRSSASVTSFARSQAQSPSVRSGRAAAPSGSRTVVTAPPWARDEPPSPHDQDAPTDVAPSRPELFVPEQPRPSDVASYQSSAGDDPIAGPSRWWAFTRHRPEGFSPAQQPQQDASGRVIPMRGRSLSVAWLTSPIYRRSEDESSPILKSKQPDSAEPIMSRKRDRGFHLDLPAPDPVVTTLSHNKTPGWDSPWTPRPPADLVARITGNPPHNGSRLADTDEETQSEKLGVWARRRKRFRSYILINAYVPLLFRFINITFTCAALAMAIRIRAMEQKHHAMGAVGSSPTVVIIFAPLTLVHVMVAIYV
ncbi:hypothetical protein EIP91_005568 [Steccherinum ochraceum]|uniref:Uncharacterized protein n=1 Tax=Steccherinum ochraceum TaxID=92696 RepID=A0A4R0RVY7_9APHY|nr:hypothetical protein EIP91_005568 [Steccherinum ochraceum]